jgi:DNA-binding NarL/FixJ family response regulator
VSRTKPDATDKSRVLVVEDDRLVALDLETMLTEFGIDVCATAFSAEDALIEARQHKPDLVLMDIWLDGKLDGVRTAEQLLRELNLRVVYVTGNSDMSTVERAKRTAPLGYVLKPIRALDLRCCLELALHQVRTKQPQGAEALGSAPPYSSDACSLVDALSAREREVMGLIALGLTSKDIAVKLGIAKPTVDTYRGRLAEKLGARSRADLVSIAARAGLLSLRVE